MSSSQEQAQRYFCAWKDLRRNFQLKDWSHHEAVQKEIAWFRNNPGHLIHLAQNASPYLHYILNTLKERRLPAEIALLPMVESLYDPTAHSYAGAVGLWQFMPHTAESLEVTHNWWFDGRKDLLESTQAALDYLEFLHQKFDGKWLLAFAAYNSGQGRVYRALQHNTRIGHNLDFWSLQLPKQTQSYVPRLLALASIIKNPLKHQINLPELSGKPYFEIIKINSQISLYEVAKLTKMDIKDILRLNPGYKQLVTHPDGPHKLLLPKDKVDIFHENFVQDKHNKRSHLIQYTIKKGDSLSKIAYKFKVPKKDIQNLNQLKNHKIILGKKLWIPLIKVKVPSLPTKKTKNKPKKPNTHTSKKH